MTRNEILYAAQQAVTGERNNQYGSPEHSFGMISSLWSTYTGYEISPSDVAAMMALLKIARISTGADHADNWIDLAGYAACGGEIQTGMEAYRCELET